MNEYIFPTYVTFGYLRTNRKSLNVFKQQKSLHYISIKISPAI